VERTRDIDNIKENLALMEMTSRAQLAQGRAQTEGWKTVNQEVRAQRLLTGDDNDAEVDGFVFDATMFDALDEIE
jgi:hypothetical protein